LVYVNIWTPQDLSSEEKTMLEKLNSSPNFKPKPDKNNKSFFERVKEAFN
jgi:molecular chaperone DnaJ